MRKPRLLLAIALAVSLLLPPIAAAQADETTPTPVAAPALGLGVGEIPKGVAGKAVQVVVPLINRGDAAAMEILVTPKPAVDPAKFPFEITQTDYTVSAGDLAAGATTDVALGEFRLRAGLATGYYAMPLSIQYGDGVTRQVIERTIFVHVEGVPEPDPNTPPPVTTDPPTNIEVPSSKGGGYLPSDGSGTGGSGDSGTGSTPRLMLTSFTTDPAEVYAGQNFRLSFALSNMSSRTGVGNIKVTVVSPDASFLPVGGASSMFIPAIFAGQSASGSIDFRALPTLEERPYQLTLRMEYEDSSNYQQLTAEETIAVVVRQRARVETSSISALPKEITVGQDTNVSFTVQNKGKVRLFNTSVRVKAGQAFSGDDQFIGNIEPGAVGTADLMLHAEKPTSTPVILEITYEDSAGVATTFERPVSVTVNEVSDDDGFQPVEPEPSGFGLAWLPVALGILAIVVGIVAFRLISKKRKESREDELGSMLEQLDDEPIVPVDPQ